MKTKISCLFFLFCLFWYYPEEIGAQESEEYKVYDGAATCMHKQINDTVWLVCTLPKETSSPKINQDKYSEYNVEGVFKKTKTQWLFWKGRYYVYDEYGLLDHIEVYENGVYIGNGVIGIHEEDALLEIDDEK